MTRQETNAWLRDLYEAMGPEFFKCQIWDTNLDRWIDCSDVWLNFAEYRLRPIVPEGCEQIPDKAYVYDQNRRGAVCLDRDGPLTDLRVAGYCFGEPNSQWERFSMFHNLRRHFLLDLSCINAPEIVRRNTGRRLPWDDALTPKECCDEMTRIAQETGQYDQPNVITIKADHFEVETRDGSLTVRWW